MADYAKKTVAELQEILKSRSLPSSGKKAELVARLNEADKTIEADAGSESTPVEPASVAPQQIPSTIQPPQPIPSVPEASGSQDVSDPVAPPPDDPATSSDSVQPLAYSLHLAQSDVSAELAKRKARADRFGTGMSTEGGGADDTDAAKALERSKRFGTGQTAIGKLDEALPTDTERGARKKARANGEASVMDDAGLKQNFRGTFRDRGSNRRSNSRQGQKPTGVQKPAAAFVNDKDRQAAEARKKRFTQA